jgi:tagatose 6-phosphate kinase
VGPVIITVTCNPAVDTTYEVDRLVTGDVHRVRAVHERPGGKGVNVARVLHGLGEPVCAVGLAAPGFAEQVEALGVEARFVDALPAVRRTLVVQDHRSTTSLWEPGAVARPGAAEDLVALVASLLPGASGLVVSGSLPSRVDQALPVRLAGLATQTGIPVVLDLDDAPLAAALGCGGAVLTPNRDELARLVGGEPADLPVAALELAARNRAPVVVTLGEDGLLATDGIDCWRAVTRSVCGNATGAGDAAAAGVVRGLVRGDPWPDLVGQAAVLGAAAVLSPVAGELDPAVIEILAASVRVDRVRTEPVRLVEASG